jgi:hypothetical protein
MNQEPVIFSRGSTLRDVPDHFKGITPVEFLRRELRAQAVEYLKSLPPADTLKDDLILPRELIDTKGREWHARHIHGSRDNYGWKSL